MAKFVLTAQMQLQAPTNLTQVRRQIQQQLGNVTINPVINTQSLANANAQITNIGNNANKASKSLNNAGRSAQSLGSALGAAARRFASITLATGFFLGLVRGISDAVGRAIEFEREMLKISQVTGKTVGQLRGLTKEVTNLATGLGVSSSELLTTARTLNQAGFSAQKTKAALEVLARTDLAATFENLQATTEGAIALLRQFRNEARAAGGDIKFLEQSLDAINAVSKNFAVEAGDLIAVIRRTGGVFEAAGGKLNELIALFTSVRGTTRETAETIATGFRTIFTRIQRTETVDQLRELGIELRNAKGEFVGPLEAIKRLQIGLAGLSATDFRFQEIVEQLGGFRQVGKVIPLLKQYETTAEALAIANNAMGSTAADAATAQQGLGNAFTKLKEQFDKTVRNIADSDTFQTLARGAIRLAESILRVVEALEPLLPLLTALAAFKLGQIAVPAFGKFAGIGGKNQGGRIYGFNKGGFVPGTGNRDTVPAMLTPGEFVIKKSSVKSIGAGNLAAVNGYNKGGAVDNEVDIFTITGSSSRLPAMGYTQGTASNRGKQMLSGPIQDSVKAKYGSEIASQFGTRMLGPQDKIILNTPFINAPANKSLAQAGDVDFIGRHLKTAVHGMAKEVGAKLDMDVPPLLKFNESAAASQALKGIDLKTISGYMFESIASTLSGSPLGAPGELFDMPQAKAHTAKLEKLFGGKGTLNNMSQMELKRTLTNENLRGPQGSLTTKLINSLITGSGGAFGLKVARTAGTPDDPMSSSGLLAGMKAANVKPGGRFFGGRIGKYNKGGSVDTVPAMLTPGEYVINKSAAQSIGYTNLNRMNQTGVSHFNKGGAVGGVQFLNKGGMASVGNAAMMATFMAPMIIEFTNLEDSTKNVASQFAMLAGVLGMLLVPMGRWLDSVVMGTAANVKESIASNASASADMKEAISSQASTVADGAEALASGVSTAADTAEAGSSIMASLAAAGMALAAAPFTVIAVVLTALVAGFMAFKASLAETTKALAESTDEMLEGIRGGTGSATDQEVMAKASALGDAAVAEEQAGFLNILARAADSYYSLYGFNIGFIDEQEKQAQDLKKSVETIIEGRLAAARIQEAANKAQEKIKNEDLSGAEARAVIANQAKTQIAEAAKLNDATQRLARLRELESNETNLMENEKLKEQIEALESEVHDTAQAFRETREQLRRGIDETISEMREGGASFAEIMASGDMQQSLDLLEQAATQAAFQAAQGTDNPITMAEARAQGAAARSGTEERLRREEEQRIKRIEELKALREAELEAMMIEKRRTDILNQFNASQVAGGLLMNQFSENIRGFAGQVSGANDGLVKLAGTLKDGLNPAGIAAAEKISPAIAARIKSGLEKNNALEEAFMRLGAGGTGEQFSRQQRKDQLKSIGIDLDSANISKAMKEKVLKMMEDGLDPSEIKELIEIFGEDVQSQVDILEKLGKQQLLHAKNLEEAAKAEREAYKKINAANRFEVEVRQKGAARLREATGKEITIAEANAELRERVNAKTGGFGGVTVGALGNRAAGLLASRNALQERRAAGQGRLTPEETARLANSQNALNDEIGRTKEALKELADQSDLAAAVMGEIEKERGKREAVAQSVKDFTFATNEQRMNMTQEFAALTRVLQTGNLNSIPDQMRAAVGNLLDQFEDIEFMPGMTGRDISRRLQVQQMEQQFRMASGGRQGVPPQLVKAIFESTTKEEKLINDLRAINEEEQAAATALRKLEQMEAQMMLEAATKQIQASEALLAWLTANAEGSSEALADTKANGGLVYRAGGGSIFKPRGTDTVPAMLTPGEFVVRKSAVDKIGIGALTALNNGNANTVYKAGGGLVGSGDAAAMNIARLMGVSGVQDAFPKADPNLIRQAWKTSNLSQLVGLTGGPKSPFEYVRQYLNMVKQYEFLFKRLDNSGVQLKGDPASINGSRTLLEALRGVTAKHGFPQEFLNNSASQGFRSGQLMLHRALLNPQAAAEGAIKGEGVAGPTRRKDLTPEQIKKNKEERIRKLKAKKEEERKKLQAYRDSLPRFVQGKVPMIDTRRKRSWLDQFLDFSGMGGLNPVDNARAERLAADEAKRRDAAMNNAKSAFALGAYSSQEVQDMKDFGFFGVYETIRANKLAAAKKKVGPMAPEMTSSGFLSGEEIAAQPGYDGPSVTSGEFGGGGPTPAQKAYDFAVSRLKRIVDPNTNRLSVLRETDPGRASWYYSAILNAGMSREDAALVEKYKFNRAIGMGMSRRKGMTSTEWARHLIGKGVSPFGKDFEKTKYVAKLLRNAEEADAAAFRANQPPKLVHEVTKPRMSEAQKALRARNEALLQLGSDVLTDAGNTSPALQMGNIATNSTFWQEWWNNLEYFKRGGSVDSVPAMLTPGEFVMSRSSVKKHGTGFMNALNRGKVPGFARGGSVGGVQYKQNGGILSSMGSGLMEGISNALSSFDGIANMLSNVASMFSDMSISHTVQVDGTLNIPGFSQQEINQIIQVIGNSVVSQTATKIDTALEQFKNELNQRSD